MKSNTQTISHTTVAARIAGEDIEQRDYVAVLNEIVEWPSFLWCGSSFSLPTDEPVRTRYLPRDPGQPHKVIGVCLPFIYVKPPRGEIIAFDTRQQQLVRLEPDNGRRIWKQMRKKRKKK